MTTKPRIDQEFLLRQFPTLISIKRKRRTWDEHGEKVVRDYLTAAAKPRSRNSGGESIPEFSSWNLAKELIHAVMASENPEYAAIRKRLGDLKNPSTANLLSTLSLWMAGVLGISVTATGPMMATMLYGVSEAAGNWEILRAPCQAEWTE